MRIEEKRIGDVTVLRVAGELDARTLPDANGKLDSLIKTMDARLVFNLSGMEIVTSSAIGFLIDAAKRTRKLGGDVVLSEPTQLFLKTLDALKMGDFFEVFATDDRAVAYFRDRGALDPAATVEVRRRRWPFRLWKGKSS